MSILNKIIITRSAAETQYFGQKLARQLKPGDLVCLTGDLGVGKTCLIQGVARGLQVKGYVNSPTFKIINEYKGKVPVYHFDLYRLDGLTDLRGLGYEEYFYGQGVSLVEWAEKIMPFLPKQYLQVEMRSIDEHTRKIILTDWRKKK
ncbi:MAG: tRNA (adenosine(37)-N6)-threonylcarbamoyltransferase complex ATPase subunit type 1 TsaE [bacterium]|nr:tRNA (adenosine(37)-N6)-threonylcarbamoyltransferase complex ATPase subunit type 1 TsaE [bacterium]MDD5353774.1 tRNA (adenosine(37)-N6)-threonylcarbamoyltransferase complex ATPase subunit type 1 TsaE [bacterium]MDD5756307.1 tRNA (adenosine(37)-N6)-threonylcarbamoyltransferase complex ATPase subunit type 1 TsaE [bacterium]